MFGITAALNELRPGASFTIRNGAVEKYKHALPMPSHAELATKARELNDAEAMRLLRELRNSLLDECDKVIMKYMTTRADPSQLSYREHPSRDAKVGVSAKMNEYRYYLSFALPMPPNQWLRFMDHLRDLPQSAKPTLTVEGELDLTSFTLPRIPISTGLPCLCAKDELKAFCKRHGIDKSAISRARWQTSGGWQFFKVVSDPAGDWLWSATVPREEYLKLAKEEEVLQPYCRGSKENGQLFDCIFFTLDTTSNCALPPLLAKYRKMQL